MALTGLIEDFGLADVLQLIVQRGKAGVILLTNEADEIRAAIEDGAIVALENRGRPMESELASRLARAHLITPAQLGTVLKRRAMSEEHIAHILIEERCAPAELVTQFATAQAIDALLDVFAWPSGKYAFVDGGIEDLVRAIHPIGMEHLLMTGIRAMDEMREIEDLVPSLDAYAERTRPLPEEAPPTLDLEFDPGAEPEPASLENAELVDDLLELSVSASELGENERLVYDLCGSGSVRHVIDRVPLSRFEALRALANLVLEGYVELS